MANILNIFSNMDNWNFIFSGVSCFFTVFTFIMAVKLYDRYGVKGKIKSNRIDIVFEMLELLKKRTMTIQGTDGMDIRNEGKLVHGYIEFGENKSLKIDDMKEYKLYFDQETYCALSVKLENLLNSLWMPKEIKETMKFILNCGTNIIEYSEMEKRNIVIKFSYSNTKNGKVVPVTKFKNYEDYRLSFENSMAQINKWLQENNIDIIF